MALIVATTLATQPVYNAGWAAHALRSDQFLTISPCQVGVSGDPSACVTDLVGLVRSPGIDIAEVVAVDILNRLRRGLACLGSVRIL